MNINTTYEMSNFAKKEKSRAEIEAENAADFARYISDPKDDGTDIGKRIFKNLDFFTKVAFSQISRGCYQRSKGDWFSTEVRQIVLRYIQRNVTYANYLKCNGWQDGIILAAKVAGTAITIASGIKAAKHASRIPKDAPTKIVEISPFEDGSTMKVTVVDHPEAYSAGNWAAISAFAGIVTIGGIVGHGIYALLKDINLDLFFTATEKELLESTTTNFGIRLLSPDFHEWKITQMRTNLSSNPPNWQNHKELSKMVCRISGDFMLFPVKDKCPGGGHPFDYRSIRAYQLNCIKPEEALQCPVSTIKPNKGLSEITFDKTRFDEIQRILREITDH